MKVATMEQVGKLAILSAQFNKLAGEKKLNKQIHFTIFSFGSVDIMLSCGGELIKKMSSSYIQKEYQEHKIEEIISFVELEISKLELENA